MIGVVVENTIHAIVQDNLLRLSVGIEHPDDIIRDQIPDNMPYGAPPARRRVV